jgi:hypothetical protein
MQLRLGKAAAALRRVAWCCFWLALLTPGGPVVATRPGVTDRLEATCDEDFPAESESEDESEGLAVPGHPARRPLTQGRATARPPSLQTAGGHRPGNFQAAILHRTPPLRC